MSNAQMIGKKRFQKRAKMVGVAACLWFVVAAPHSIAQQAKPEVVARLPGLQLQLVADKTSYALGEPISILMRYEFDGDETLSVRVIDFDRSGRVGDYRFSAVDANGIAVRDPVSRLGGMGGGPIAFTKLSKTQPFEQRATINEWLAFDKPGRFLLRAHSNIISRGEGVAGAPIPLDSQPLAIEITAPDEASRLLRLEMAKNVLPGVDSENDRTNRQTRFKAVQDLRFLLDVRAVPLLVQALGDGFINIRLEARRGLDAFEDKAPIKAEMMRVLNDEALPIAPSAKSDFLSFLLASEKAGDQVTKSAEERRATYLALNARFDQKLRRQIQKLPLAEAARITVEAMRESQLDKTAPENWKPVLASAAVMNRESQEHAAEMLMVVLNVDATHGKPMDAATIQDLRDDFKRAASDERVEGTLRLAALLGLHRSGDDSGRELLFKDVMRPQTQILRLDGMYPQQVKAAREVLGTDKANEIAARLLELLASPLPQDYPDNFVVWRSLLWRVRDFGSAATLPQLSALYKRVIDEAPFHQTDDTLRQIALEAVVLKSPDAAVPLIASLPRNPQGDYGLRVNAISNLLCRINTPAARNSMEQLLASDDEKDRLAVLSGLARNEDELHEKSPTSSSFLPPQRDIAPRFVPQILRLFLNDPSKKVRASAFYALGQITGVPRNVYYAEKNADDKHYVAQWKEWRSLRSRPVE